MHGQQEKHIGDVTVSEMLLTIVLNFVPTVVLTVRNPLNSREMEMKKGADGSLAKRREKDVNTTL